MQEELHLTNKEEKKLDSIFRIAVFLKGAQGIIDFCLGVIVAIIPLRFIPMLADKFTEAELHKDPDDFIATHLVDFAHSVDIGAQHYAAIYLLLHGAVKLILAFALLSGKRWAYPFGLIVIGLFIAYQVFRVYLRHSPLLAVATILDMLLFYFIWREYQIVKRHAH